MTLMPTSYDLIIDPTIQTYEQAQQTQSNLIWQKLNEITIRDAIGYWMPTLSSRTQMNYASGMKKLIENRLMDPLMSLQVFALVNHESVIDQIKLVTTWSECTRHCIRQLIDQEIYSDCKNDKPKF